MSLIFLIGGNVGLFTGMSVLSIFEVLFWIARFIFSSPRKDKEKAKQAELMQFQRNFGKRKRQRYLSLDMP